MRKQKFRYWGAIVSFLLFSLLWSACGGSSATDEETVVISGVVSMAPVVGAIVTASAVKPNGSIGETLGTTTTNSVGYWEMVIRKTNDPIVISASFGRYVDEATGQSVSLSSGETYRALFASASASRTVAVTPLSHIAAEAGLAAAKNGEELTAAKINNIAKEVGEALGFSATYDIREVKPVNPYDSSAVSQATDAEKQYALFLAGLSQQAKEKNVSQRALIQAYVDDFSDGEFDGRKSGATITVGSSSLGSSDWNTGVRGSAATWQASDKNTTGLPAVNFAAKLTDGTLSASASSSSALSLSWSGFGSATSSYKIVYASGSSAPANCSSGSSLYTGSASSYSHTGLTTGTYSYRICGLDSAGNMTSGVTASATTNTLTDGNVEAGTYETKVVLTLSGFSSDTTSYRIVRANAGVTTPPADCNSGTLVYSGSATSFEDTGLTPATDYAYRVCAVDVAGNRSAGRQKIIRTNSP